ncbi:MAG TPA: flagellar motor protein MotB [Candidatus Binatia bacterium]|nr:flagellar motor protein MotB [Candidatus Binatia bacterium]
MPPERRRPRAPAPPPLDDDQTGWLVTFSDLVLQLFAFVLVSAVLVGAAERPAPPGPAPAPPPAAPAPGASPPADAPPRTAAPAAAEPDRPVATVPDTPAPAVHPAVETPVPAADAPARAPVATELAGAERALRALVAADGRADAVHVAVRDADLVVTLSDTITFPSGSAELLPGAAPILRRIGTLARSMPGFDVEVGGHTDDVPIHGGAYPSNLELSLARAARVARELATEAPELTARTIAAGYGEHRPAAPNADEEGRARNRRVEIRLVPRPEPRG